MNYWIFKANPKLYRIDERLQNEEPNTTWKITRYKDQIHTGDLAFIWRTGNPPAICALMKIDAEPEEMEEIEIERPYYIEPEFEKILRVRGRFIWRFPLISSKELKETPGLQSLSVFSGFKQGTNFKVSHDEGKILLKVVQYRGEN
jgi:predicted RNA-binding protein with PUA-like domain